MKANTKVVGELFSQGRSYGMLDLAPLKRAKEVPFSLQEYSLIFSCVVDGLVQPLVVSRGNFLIVPFLEPTELEVMYYIEDTESELPLHIVSENVE